MQLRSSSPMFLFNSAVWATAITLAIRAMHTWVLETDE